MNLHDLDPATFQSGPKLDALIAEKWMGWEWRHDRWLGWVLKGDLDGTKVALKSWSPSTNPAHAGEARRKADYWELRTLCAETGELIKGYEFYMDLDGKFPDGPSFFQQCLFTETNNDKAAAEALATCRAIVAALQAVEAEKELRAQQASVNRCGDTTGRNGPVDL